MSKKSYAFRLDCILETLEVSKSIEFDCGMIKVNSDLIHAYRNNDNFLEDAGFYSLDHEGLDLALHAIGYVVG
jgi:hypothetical protein